MLSRNEIEQQLALTLEKIEAPFLGTKIEGKVRDSYVLGDRRVLVTSDRLSAFDRVLTTIPFKGQMLNQMATYWFKETAHIVPNHLLSVPHPNVLLTKQVQIVPVEVVVRGYLAGSAWRDYQAGRSVSGVALPKGLIKSARFDKPLLTPSTKAPQGEHDQPISSEEIVSSGLVEKKLWEEIGTTALSLFEFGSKKAAERGLILVDTKYEFGLLLDQRGKSQLVLADEIHTQDSSRYWIAESYPQAFQNQVDPVMLDKEFVRRWLIDRGYMGEGAPPTLTNDFRVDTAMKYMEACEMITGLKFSGEVGSVQESIMRVLEAIK